MGAEPDSSGELSPSAERGRALRVLVAGASGFIGSHLCRYLESTGHQVTRLVRRPPRPNTNEVLWNPAAGRLEPAQVSGFHAVINLAGENIAGGRWTSAMKQRIRDSRVQTTRLLAQAIAAADPRPAVFICASAVGYYGNREAEVLTEASSPGSGFLVEVCRGWEAAAEPARAAGVRVVNLRTGVVLSPAGGALAKMLTPFRMGLGGIVGSGNQWISWIALSDLLRVFEFVLSREELSGPVNAVSPNPIINREFTKTLGTMLNRPTVVPLPAAAVRLTMGEMGTETLLASTRAVPEKLESAGFAFQHPRLADALEHEMSSYPDS